MAAAGEYARLQYITAGNFRINGYQVRLQCAVRRDCQYSLETIPSHIGSLACGNSDFKWLRQKWARARPRYSPQLEIRRACNVYRRYRPLRLIFVSNEDPVRGRTCIQFNGKIVECTHRYPRRLSADLTNTGCESITAQDSALNYRVSRPAAASCRNSS